MFSKKRKAYKSVFSTSQGEEVMKDLYVFCGQNAPTFVPGDPYASAYKEGMRRVFLRIQQFVNLKEDEMHKIINTTQGE